MRLKVKDREIQRLTEENRRLTSQLTPDEIKTNYENQRQFLNAVRLLSEEGLKTEKQANSVKVNIITSTGESQFLNIKVQPSSLSQQKQRSPQKKSQSSQRKSKSSRNS